MHIEVHATPADAIHDVLREGGWLAGAPVIAGVAPGRLDALGGIADYSGATVLELPLAIGALVAAQRVQDGQLTVRTIGPALPDLVHTRIQVPADAVTGGAAQDAPERLRAALAEVDGAWAAYVLGPLAMLRAAGLVRDVRGLRLAIWSNVPAGAGLSSSAALEVAALRALLALFAQKLEPLEMARLAQQAEHRVALAPCGIMDQATAVLGRKGHLLLLRCQPAEVMGYQALARDAQIYGIDSAVTHRIGGGQYGRVRTATFMGRAIIAAQGAGDPPGGYLCNLALHEFQARYAPLLPIELRGDAFLARYGETGDDATRVEPDTLYRVRDCTTHPIAEQANVSAFLEAMRAYQENGDPQALAAAGAAMYRSHASYGTRCGLGTPETDLLVDLVRERGPQAGLYGAKITGGGSGGTVAVLAAGDDARTHVEHIAAEYAQRTGYPARVIAGSGEGALSLPVWRLTAPENGAIT